MRLEIRINLMHFLHESENKLHKEGQSLKNIWLHIFGTIEREKLEMSFDDHKTFSNRNNSIIKQ